MASYNRVVLVGNLTRDIELRYIPSGTAVAEIGLAVNDRVKRGDQWVDETTFVDVTLWGRTAEVANQYLNKGSSILIEGRLKLDTWEKDGQKRSKLRVVAEKMQMLGGRGEGGGGGGGSRSTGSRAPARQQDSYDSGDDGGYGGGGYDNYSSAPAAPPEDDIPF
ncbi:single-stranded DNA-binding protein [Botrimarina mediterranea]|uniref:Single-stranded DNA-binding protein n=1 Tax=Botrimarina mediterranea TaxID=2528022 RepID=A0A518K413_9BACT|nr:single-stranded DNA-binding protein [Botrimarina mediterranea]QDV72536.1 Single-stranded DNA-binding protein [Botrimarina mediterranea]QDV77108.1 Single-stranded DNA-binding protein [Planctomycetes bacterium K2D]